MNIAKTTINTAIEVHENRHSSPYCKITCYRYIIRDGKPFAYLRLKTPRFVEKCVLEQDGDEVTMSPLDRRSGKSKTADITRFGADDSGPVKAIAFLLDSVVFTLAFTESRFAELGM